MIIIDTPNSCVTCPLSHYNAMYSEHQCQGKDYYETINDFDWQRKQVGGKDLKPDWCPLKPVPDRINLRQYVDNTACNLDNIVAYQYAQGWNGFRDKILEEKNENN